MIARRFALATLVAAGAFAVAGCGMMDRDKGGAGVMSVPLSGKNEEPPNASTFPLPNNTAVCRYRLVVSEPVAVQLSDAGSYNSVGATAQPPVTKTLPLVSNVAV